MELPSNRGCSITRSRSSERDEHLSIKDRDVWLDTETTTRTQSVVNKVTFIEGVDAQLLPAMFKALESQFQLTPRYLSMLITCQGIFQGLAGPIWGYLADTHSRVQLLAFACCCWGFISLMFSRVKSFSEMLTLKAMSGIALSSMTPIAQSFIADLFPSNQRGKAFGWFMLSLTLGCTVGVVFGASLSRKTFVHTGMCMLCVV